MVHWIDLRYAIRLLRRSPLFTLLTVVVLSGGLALSIFTFSFLHTAMVRPLPLGDGDRIVRIQQASGTTTGGFEPADLVRMRPAIRSLVDVGAFTTRQFVVGREGNRRVLGATVAEWNIFEATRTQPAIGRGFRPDDQVRGAEPVVLLGYRTWEVMFGGDRSVVGTLVDLNSVPTRVIGVMPRGYGFPVAAEAWVPLGADVLDATAPGEQPVELFGRIAPGATSDAVSAEMQLLLDRAREGRPSSETAPAAPAPRVIVRSFPMAQFGDEGPLMLGVLNLLAGLILLLSCINVTNLLLARANERARETAVRLALGASRGRLVMQNLWESVVLCLVGGLLATLLAAWGLGAITRWTHAHLEGNLAFWWVWRFDRTTLLAAGAFITLTIALLGVVVSFRASSTQFTAVLRDGGARSGARREGRLSRALVITQVATVSILMFFGVMSAIVAYRVAHVDPGFETRQLLSASIELQGEAYASPDRRGKFYQGLHDALGQWPAVESVLLRTGLADIGSAEGEFELGGRMTGSTVRPRAFLLAILGSPATLGLDVRAGRSLDATDTEVSAPVAMVSEAFAAKHFPGGTAVGRQIRLTGVADTMRMHTIVGVVGDMLLGNPLSRDRSAQAIYIPLRQSGAQGTSIVFRHRGDAAAAQAALMQSLAALDPVLLPPDVQTYDEILEKTALIARSVSNLFAFCFGFALLLAVSGTYGLMARSIGQRTREIGVRRALGASDPSIIRLLVGQGSRQLGIGAVLALPAMLLTGIGFSKFFPISLWTALIIACAVAATIVTVVLFATYVPTRKALGVPAREALWRE